MRSTQTLRGLLAGALALTLFQFPRAAAGGSSPTYTIPPRNFTGCQTANAGDPGSCNPSYQGRGGTFACTDRGPEASYVKDREAKIKALTDLIDTLDAEIAALDADMALLQVRIDQAESPGSTTDLATLRDLQKRYSEDGKSRHSLNVKDFNAMRDRAFLLNERDKTEYNHHEGCHCQYFCDTGSYQCPGEPPPPPAPNKPRIGIGGGQCR